MNHPDDLYGDNMLRACMELTDGEIKELRCFQGKHLATMSKRKTDALKSHVRHGEDFADTQRCFVNEREAYRKAIATPQTALPTTGFAAILFAASGSDQLATGPFVPSTAMAAGPLTAAASVIYDVHASVTAGHAPPTRGTGAIYTAHLADASAVSVENIPFGLGALGGSMYCSPVPSSDPQPVTPIQMPRAKQPSASSQQANLLHPSNHLMDPRHASSIFIEPLHELATGSVFKATTECRKPIYSEDSYSPMELFCKVRRPEYEQAVFHEHEVIRLANLIHARPSAQLAEIVREARPRGRTAVELEATIAFAENAETEHARSNAIAETNLRATGLGDERGLFL